MVGSMEAADRAVLSRAPSAEVLAPIWLRDGTRVDLHPMEAADADALVRFHHRLSSETTYLRFFTVHPELSADEVDRFTHVDHLDREAIVATIDREIVAVARFDRLDDAGEAEAAFVVADSWQGEGLGSELLRRLALRAREVDVHRLVAEVMPQNRRMMNVFQHAGLPVSSTFRDGVVHLAVDLLG
jgi:RimJ/RimL family protein N-acetyltransferase